MNGTVNVPGISLAELKAVDDKAQRALDMASELANTIDAVPFQGGSLIYNGSVQVPNWNGYNPESLSIGGVTTGINAGTYQATFTPKGDYHWSDGTKTAKAVVWTITRAAIANPPSQSGTLIYTGTTLSPIWSEYDSAKLSIGGIKEGTNAGLYVSTFTPTANYQWSDGTTIEKSVNWSISKVAGGLTLDKTTMTLTNGALTGTITVTRYGDGAISATSSNNSVATVSVLGTTITVTGKAYGNATITVSVAEGTNHNASSSKMCNVTAKIYSTALNANTWAQIREISDAGMGPNYWNVGDAKTIIINGTVGQTAFSNLSIDVFILGFNHNSSLEGANRIHFQIGKIGGKLVGLTDINYGKYTSSPGDFEMYVRQNGDHGWSYSNMRTVALGNNGTPTSPPANSLLAAMPSDLCQVMKSVTKYSDNTANGSNNASYVTSTTDYLFLLAEFEFDGVGIHANSAEKTYQAQYDYYRAGNSRIHYMHNSTTDAAIVWIRSFWHEGGYGGTVTTDGKISGTTPTTSYAVSPAFCV